MDFRNLFIRKTKIRENPNQIQEVFEENNEEEEKDPQDIMNYAYLREKRLNLKLIEKVTPTDKTFKKTDNKDNLVIETPKNEITIKELTEILNKNIRRGNDDLDTAPNFNTEGDENKYSIDKKIFKLYQLFNKFHNKEIANKLTKAEIFKRKSNQLIENDSKAKEGDKLKKVMENVFNLNNLTKKLNEKILKKNDVLRKSLQEKIITNPVNSKIKRYIKDKFLFYQDDINQNHINYLINEVLEEKENQNYVDPNKNYQFEFSKTESDDADFDPIPNSYGYLNNEDLDTRSSKDLDKVSFSSRKSLKNLKNYECNLIKGKPYKPNRGDEFDDNGVKRQRNSQINLKKVAFQNFNTIINNIDSLNHISENIEGGNKNTHIDSNLIQKKSLYVNNSHITNLNDIKTKKSINPNNFSLNFINIDELDEQIYSKYKCSELIENTIKTPVPESPNTIKYDENSPQIKTHNEENYYNLSAEKKENESKRVSSQTSNNLTLNNDAEDFNKGLINNISDIKSKRKKLSPINISLKQDKDSTRFNTKQNSNLINSSINNSLSIYRSKNISKSIDVSNSSPLSNKVKRSFDFKTHGIDENKLFSYLREVTKNTKGKFLNYKDSIVYKTIQEFFDNNTIKNEKTEQLNLDETQKTKIILNSLLNLGLTSNTNKDIHVNNKYNVHKESKFIKYNIELDPEIPIDNNHNVFSFYNNNVKTLNTTNDNHSNHELYKDKIKLLKNSQGTNIPLVYTKFTLNDYSSDDDENRAKNKSNYIDSIDDDQLREENEYPDDNSNTKKRKKGIISNTSKQILNLYTYEETLNIKNKDNSQIKRSKNQKEYLSFKKELKERSKNIEDNKLSLRKSSNNSQRKIVNDKISFSPNKGSIQDYKSLILPNISQNTDVKRKEPISKYSQMANEKLKNSIIMTKTKLKTAFLNNEEEEDLKKTRF